METTLFILVLISIVKGNELSSEKVIFKTIEGFEGRISEEEKFIILQQAYADDPPGYACNNDIEENEELEFVDQVECHNKTEKICSMVQTTVYESKPEKKCETHFKKTCWIDFEDKPYTHTVQVCNKKPERKCDETLRNGEEKQQTCKDHYETVCNTEYIQRNVPDSKVDCEIVNEKSCSKENDKEVCIEVPKQKCSVKEVVILKSFPITKCGQEKKEICTDALCPITYENEVCEDIKKTHVRRVPRESCDVEPREVCSTVQVQYPVLKMEEQCQFVPRQACTTQRVQPKLAKKPVIKKVCTQLPPPICPSNDPKYVTINSKCFYIEDKYLTFTQARDNCKDVFPNGGRLFEPRTEEENDKVHLNFVTFLETIDRADPKAYIGIQDMENEGTFVYDHSGDKIEITMWDTSQPDNEEGVQHCTTFWKKDKATWDDIGCNSEHMSICEGINI